jgi:hypothetical protein
MRVQKKINGSGVSGLKSQDRGLKLMVLILGFLACSLWLTGCGYTTRSLISNKFKTIYVAQFLNNIDITSEAKTSRRYQVYRPTLETDVTRAVIDRFMLDGNLRIVREEDADLALKGSLVDFRRDVLRYAVDDTPEEYRISIVVDISLRDRKEESLVWEEKNFIGDSTYFVSGINAKSEDTAVAEAVGDLARRIVERAVEAW